MTTYGYIRTSRQRIQGTAGSDPEAQAHQLHQDGVSEANIHRDVGISGGTGTNSRAGWRTLNTRLAAGDTLVVVAIDRIGRRWQVLDSINLVGTEEWVPFHVKEKVAGRGLRQHQQSLVGDQISPAVAWGRYEFREDGSGLLPFDLDAGLGMDSL